ncbi:hypothetical protein ALO81_05128, partial [Pseudomonas cannabina]
MELKARRKRSVTEAVTRCNFAYGRPDLRNPDPKTQDWSGDYIVWWYGPAMRNNRAMSIPLGRRCK